MLVTCGIETNTNMDLPLSESQLLIFIGWLIERNLSSKTIESYLAAIRQQYLQEGLDPKSIRSTLINQVVKGRAHQNLDKPSKHEPKFRLPITPTILKLIKIFLARQPLNNQEKLLIWSICTLSFHGSFRIHEILCNNSSAYNPYNSLLRQDIKIKSIVLNKERVEILEVRIKQSKTNDKAAPTIVDVFQSTGPLCPVAAYKKWQKNSTLSGKDLPVFRRENGKPFTGRCLNKFLKEFSNEKFPTAPGKFTAHSLRAGLPSLLGQLGFEDNDIKATGRWSSRAFQLYTKLPRSRRAEMAKKLATLKL